MSENGQAARTPPPGSPDALERGCVCPVIDNGHGRGILGGTIRHPESGRPVYSFVFECPLHGDGDWADA